MNVPIGAALLPLAWLRLTESIGPDRSLDLPGLGLISAGLFGVVWGIVRGDDHGWSSLGVVAPIVLGVMLLVAFVLRECRAAEPMRVAVGAVVLGGASALLIPARRNAWADPESAAARPEPLCPTSSGSMGLREAPYFPPARGY